MTERDTPRSDDPGDWLASQFGEQDGASSDAGDGEQRDPDLDLGERDAGDTEVSGSDVPAPRAAASGFAWGLRPRTPEELLADEAHTDEAHTDEAHADEAHADEAHADEAHAADAGPDGTGVAGTGADGTAAEPPAAFDASIPGPPDPAVPPAVLTMEEVLDAPSPRRAAREAAAREAALAASPPSASATGSPDASASAPDPVRPPADPPAESPVSVPPTPQAPTPAASTPSAPTPPPTRLIPPPVLGSAEGRSERPTTSSPDVVPPVLGDAPSLGRDPGDAVRIAPAVGTTGGEPDASIAGPDSAAATTADASPLAAIPATAGAPTPIFADADGTEPEKASVARGAGRSMTSRQRVIFLVLAAVIVVALVILVLVLTGQGGASSTGALAFMPALLETAAGIAPATSA